MTDLAQSQKGPTACRRVEMHFTGGLRGSNWEPGELVIWPYNGPQRLLVGDIPESQIQRAISSLGLLCIGIDEVLEEPHLVMRLWHPFWYNEPPDEDPADHWSGISAAAKQAGDADFALLAEKVAFSLRATGIRLRDVSDEYLRQLKAAFGEGHGLEHRFGNVAVLDLHLACHSLLAEMGSARDYLAMVIARHASAPTGIDDMGGLRNWLRSRKVSLPDAVLAALAGNRSDPWLDDLAGYRNAFVHRSPVSTIESARRLRLREHDTPYPGFPIWIRPTRPKAAETLAEPRIPAFTRRVRPDSAT